MELRERCIEQVLVLLSEQGLRFTMSDLAKALGVSKKTLYTVFDSKEAMLLATADACFAAIKKAEGEILADQTLPLLERIGKLIIVLPEQYKSLNWYLMGEVEERYPQVYSHIRSCMESDWEPTLRLLEEGIGQGALRPISLPIFKSMVEGCMEHFLTSAELSSQGISYTEALENMMDILMKGIKKEESKL